MGTLISFKTLPFAVSFSRLGVRSKGSSFSVGEVEEEGGEVWDEEMFAAIWRDSRGLVSFVLIGTSGSRTGNNNNNFVNERRWVRKES